LHQDLAPENIKQTNWIPGKQAFTKVAAPDKHPVLKKVSVPDLTETTLFTLSAINHQLFNGDSLESIPQVHWADANFIYFKHKTVLYKGYRSTDGAWQFKKWVKLPPHNTNFYVGKDKKQVAFTR